MRLLALTLAALALSGCATLQPRLGWYCSAEETAGTIRAQSFRFLDHTGKLRTARTEWFYKPVNDSVDARVEWTTRAPIQDYRAATIVLRHFTQPPPEWGQLVVYSERDRIAGPYVHISIRSTDLPGRQLIALRSADTAFGIHTYNPRGEPMGGSGIEWRTFNEGLAIAQRLDARTRAMAADLAGRCEREQRIILT